MQVPLSSVDIVGNLPPLLMGPAVGLGRRSWHRFLSAQPCKAGPNCKGQKSLREEKNAVSGQFPTHNA
ncbi:MAG: hypothetical protein CBB71_21900 [Rhodopirellula sp. TMED11]|nr:MAG: hypothetical protein CBB71_21900 [Rhodopirellula sp. TMED11]